MGSASTAGISAGDGNDSRGKGADLFASSVADILVISFAFSARSAASSWQSSLSSGEGGGQREREVTLTQLPTLFIFAWGAASGDGVAPPPFPRAGKSLLLSAGAPWSRAVLSCCCVFFCLAGARPPVAAVPQLAPRRLFSPPARGTVLVDFGGTCWIGLNFPVQD